MFRKFYGCIFTRLYYTGCAYQLLLAVHVTNIEGLVAAIRNFRRKPRRNIYLT